MARPQNRKRVREDNLPHSSPPTKRLKPRGEPREKSNFPPEFWDRLSKVWLTPRALRELDRRNNLLPPLKPAASGVTTTDLARFARHGGPDLDHLRGCPEPKSLQMASSRQSRSSPSSHSIRAQTTNATSITSKVKRSSAYDDNFEEQLIDNHIYPPLYTFSDDRRRPKPNNIDDIRQRLSTTRPSLSPSQFDDDAFEDFQANNRTRSEGTIMRTVIPTIAGKTNISNDGQLPFTNFISMTGGATVTVIPDYYDGANAHSLDRRVKQDLSSSVVPTKHANDPIAPNFFLEAKAASGGVDVAQRQACHDGAYGARAMHSLQNYGQQEPVYDGNAYAFSSTYQGGTGTLQLYAHHATAPTTPGALPEYYMTQIKTYGLTSDREAFVQGATAFRNTRDLAKQYRDVFIREANARARRPAQEEYPAGSSEIPQGGVSSPNDFFDRERSAGLQGLVPEYIYSGDDADDPSQESALLDIEVSTDLVTSFTPSMTSNISDSSRPKRHRSSHSPPSNSRRHKKHASAKPYNSSKDKPIGGKGKGTSGES